MIRVLCGTHKMSNSQLVCIVAMYKKDARRTKEIKSLKIKIYKKTHDKPIDDKKATKLRC